MLLVKLNGSRLDTKKRFDKLFKIEKEINLIVNSSMFKDLILAIPTKHGELSHWGKASNYEVYEHIMSGSQELSPAKDGVIEVYFDDYYSWKNVIGYTYPNIDTIYVNTRYFDSDDLTPEMHNRKLSGSNCLHEISHKIGFDHDFRATNRRPFSLSYILNDIYEKCWDKLIAPNLKRKEVQYSYRKWFKTYWGSKVELHD